MPNILVHAPNLPFGRAKKTAPIKAIPLVTLFHNMVVNKAIIEAMVLNTLEGPQNLHAKPETLVCVGVAGEFWQQPKAGVFKSYDITDIDENGWLVCTPKPEAERNYFQVPEEIGRFRVYSQWGTEIEDPATWSPVPNPDSDWALENGGMYKCFLFGKGGDVIVQSQDDEGDVWIVDSKIWRNTHAIIEACGKTNNLTDTKAQV